jgi:hypothetical protein
VVSPLNAEDRKEKRLKKTACERENAAQPSPWRLCGSGYSQGRAMAGLILKRRALALIRNISCLNNLPRRIEMRVLAVAAIITSLAVPAFAAEDPAKAEANKAVEQKKKESEEIDKAYKDTLKKTTREKPVKKADPWGGAR